MADYKELLRRAISALPENNGAARRAVYEKARSALVGQLRAINPPLPARDITQHRLQLEDCIRQVEQEASEANITLGRDAPPARAAAPPPQPVAPPAAAPVTSSFSMSRATPAAAPTPAPVSIPVATPSAQTAIEDIIAAAESGSDMPGDKPEPAAAETPPAEARPMPNMVRSGPTSPMPQATAPRSFTLEPRRDPALALANALRVEPSMGVLTAARPDAISAVEARPVETALSSVREVEVEAPPKPSAMEAEGAIERAIETLDREARGEKTAMLPETLALARPGDADRRPEALDADRDEPAPARRGAGLTIFLVVFALLLIGAAGAGYWAWTKGYVDQMFGGGSAATAVADAQTPTTTTPTPTLDSTATAPATAVVPPATTGPGNTAASATTDAATSTLDGLEPEERLTPTPTASVPGPNTPATVDTAAGTTTTPSIADARLPEETPVQTAAADPANSVDPAVLAGSQSLLLEASSDGKTGAVPFSGTVDWSEGVDEIGMPTLVGKANIPARNLSLDLIIRKNADPSLPASHLMEVNFTVSDSFIGGTIAGLPGVLLKNEELVQGTPLVGASARVVGSSFLFALSAADKDVASNTDLLTSRKWIDFAVIYGTGTRAIITLEKDDKAQALFTKVFSAWSTAK